MKIVSTVGCILALILIDSNIYQTYADNTGQPVTAQDMLKTFSEMENVIEDFIDELNLAVQMDKTLKMMIGPKLDRVTEMLREKLDEGNDTIELLAEYQEKSMQLFRDISGAIKVIGLIIQRRNEPDSEKDWDKAFELIKKSLHLKDEL